MEFHLKPSWSENKTMIIVYHSLSHTFLTSELLWLNNIKFNLPCTHKTGIITFVVIIIINYSINIGTWTGDPTKVTLYVRAVQFNNFSINEIYACK